MGESPLESIAGLLGGGLSGDTTSPDALRRNATFLESLASTTGYQSLATFALGMRELAVEIENDSLAATGQTRFELETPNAKDGIN